MNHLEAWKFELNKRDKEDDFAKGSNISIMLLCCEKCTYSIRTAYWYCVLCCGSDAVYIQEVSQTFSKDTHTHNSTLHHKCLILYVYVCHMFCPAIGLCQCIAKWMLLSFFCHLVLSIIVKYSLERLVQEHSKINTKSNWTRNTNSQIMMPVINKSPGWSNLSERQNKDVTPITVYSQEFWFNSELLFLL